MKVFTAMTPVITKVYSNFVIRLSVLVLLCVGWTLATPAWAQTLTVTVTEHQITTGTGYDTTPTVGGDDISDLVVFTSRDTVGSDGTILMQRIGSDGAPDGEVVPISEGVTNDQLNDTHGSYVVYTAFDPGQANSGSIMLYDIDLESAIPLGGGEVVGEARIHNDFVVWIEGDSASSTIMFHDIDSGNTDDLLPISAVANADIGDKWIVWDQQASTGREIWGRNILGFTNDLIAGGDGMVRYNPSTSGDVIVWEEFDLTKPTSTQIVGVDLAVGTHLLIADNGFLNSRPSMDGDLVAFESTAGGDWDVMVHDLSTGATHVVSTDPSNQTLNHIYGNNVAYVDNRSGNPDVFLAHLSFAEVDPCADRGGDANNNGICDDDEQVNTAPVADAGPDQVVILLGSTIQLDGTNSKDDDGDMIYYAWSIISSPATSLAEIGDPASPTPMFIADVQGDYVIELVVGDGLALSAPDSVTVSFDNVPPVADAGDNQVVGVGDTVTLIGSGTDANGDPLTYSWNFVSRPTGSTAMLTGDTTSTASFTADLSGYYIISLVVNDGTVDSASSNVSVTATDTQSEVIDGLGNIAAAINALDSGVFKNKRMKNALTNKINATLAMIDDGRYQEALDKLENDILKKTDGCTGGSPDRNDWIRDCAAQSQVYPLVVITINLLTGLI